jgi:phosphinothricin acetyltransferase
MAFVLRPAEDADLTAITAIYNDAVLNTTAIFNDHIRDIDDRRRWIGERNKRGFPVLVAEEDGVVLGYASFGDFRPFDGFRYTVEDSVYVAPPSRGRGVAGALLARLIEEAQRLGKHVMVAAITADNTISLRLHARHGFVESARMPELGYKFGRWHELVLMQRFL